MAQSNLALVDAKAAWRSHAMFRAMSGDYLLREQFSTDPMQIFADYVLGDAHAGLDADAANQLVFAVFSSSALRRWLGTYAGELGGQSPSRHQFASRFAGAAAKARDEAVTLALVRGAASEEDLFSAQVDFFRSVLSTMGRVDAAGTEMSPGTATEMSPGHGTEMSPGRLDLAGRLAQEIRSAVQLNAQLVQLETGTEQSPGGTESGTEMSPGAAGGGLIPRLIAILKRAELFSLQLHRADGTEMSPGTATEMSPGIATDKSPGAWSFSERLVAEVRAATRFASGLLSGEGTEMSPGTATEMSPGHGTEKSPGALGLAESLAESLRRAELFSDALVRGRGTEMSPGTATEMSPGIATERSLGDLSDRLVGELFTVERYIAELSRMQAGTEMSPSGGTEISPGGTEMSPGALQLGQALVAVLRNAERLALHLARASEGTEMSPGTSTEMSPGAANLAWRMVDEIRLVSQLADGLARADGTEMSPGGTEMSPGGTEMSPGRGAVVFVELKELRTGISRVQKLLGQIRLTEGTEMSPGTGTEMSPGGGGTDQSPGGGGTEVSPGTGTEMSPGAFGGYWGSVQLPAHVATALNALVQYASFVRGRGALRVSGLEIG
ncbi:hypothetical protein [Caulobacter sp. LARHSG274]